MTLFGGAAARRRLAIVPLGEVPPLLLERVAAAARATRRFDPQPPQPALDPEPFLDARRRQHRADLVLAALKPRIAAPQAVLGVTTLDLCLPVLTYVFGFAELGGVAAVVSAARLDPRWHAEPKDDGLCCERLEKETVHELGHLLALTHCHDRTCPMASAHDVGEIDLEEPRWCRSCVARLG